jgi:small subunit ribosomal protein S21
MQKDRAKKQFYAIVPGHPNAVNVQEGDLVGALRVWKRNVKDSGLLQELHTRKEYEKPSVARRKARQRAVYRQKRENG